MRLFDREKFVRQYAGCRGDDQLSQNGYPALENALDMNYLHYLELNNGHRLQKTIIGHYDLCAQNILAEQTPNGWRPSAVIDFAAVQPSSPECELRYMWGLSEHAGLAARQAYEAAAGIELDEELLGFWAVA